MDNQNVHNDKISNILEKIWTTVKNQSKKITFLACVTVVGVGIDVYYNIVDHQEEGISDELIRDSVMEYISTIESTFNIEDIPISMDSVCYPDIHMIKNFKILCLDFANETRELYNTPSVTKYKNKSFHDLLLIEQSWDDKMVKRRENLEKMTTIIEKLDSFGNKYNINNYVVNQVIYNDFLEAEELVSKKSDELMNQALAIYNKTNSLSERNKDDFIKIISLQERSCKNSYIYQRDKKLFTFLLTLNQNYDVQLKKYKLVNNTYGRNSNQKKED